MTRDKLVFLHPLKTVLTFLVVVQMCTDTTDRVPFSTIIKDLCITKAHIIKCLTNLTYRVDRLFCIESPTSVPFLFLFPTFMGYCQEILE